VPVAAPAGAVKLIVAPVVVVPVAVPIVGADKGICKDMGVLATEVWLTVVTTGEVGEDE
jgi:hypothetical protein